MLVTIAMVIAAIGPLLVVLGTLMSSVTKVAGGIRTLQSVFSAMKLAFATNPFLLVIAGIVLLIGGLILAYNKVKWFRDGVNAFFSGIRDIGVQVFKFLSKYVGGSFDSIIANFNNFKASAMRIFNGVIDFITGIFTGNWEKAWNGVVNIFGGIFDGIAAMVKAPINSVIGLINNFLGNLNGIKIPKWVPKFGGQSFSIGKIPYLAKGGDLINGQAIVGEAGPELLNVGNGKTTVTPLSESDKKNGNSRGDIKIEQHNHFGKVDYNNPSERFKMDRDLQESARQAIIDAGGIPT